MNEIKGPECFGELNKVFPKKKNGDRNSPIACLGCVFKTECIQEAMKGDDGVKFREERLHMAEKSGMISFFERWSQKKALYKKTR